MSSKVKRKVTVENSKDNAEQPRRPSVFERLGPGAVSIIPQSQDRHQRGGGGGSGSGGGGTSGAGSAPGGGSAAASGSSGDTHEKCRNWLRTGNCVYGSSCRYQHDAYSSTSKHSKKDKNINEKDLRHKVRIKRVDNKDSRSGSVSPKRKGSKRSTSRSRKGEHESKIKSTVVVTRPRSPNSDNEEREKKKRDDNWEDDSDDWPLDAAQLDYKEELTLERKRQQLQRELELELAKERLLNESVTITKTVSFSESSSSSSSSSSSESGSISTTSSSSSSSDSDDSSSSSSSSSSSTSGPAVKKKKTQKSRQQHHPKDQSSEKGHEHSTQIRSRDDDRSRSRTVKSKGLISTRLSLSPSPEPKSNKRFRDLDGYPVSPKHKTGNDDNWKGSNSSKGRGPRTPSPPSFRKKKQWEHSSSADSQEGRRGRGKRRRHHREQPSRNDAHPFSTRQDNKARPPTPPPLSSPNRTALSSAPFKKHRQRGNVEESLLKVNQRGRQSSPTPQLSHRSQKRSLSPVSQEPGLRKHYLSPDREKNADRKRDLSLDRRVSYHKTLPPPPIEDDLPLHSKHSVNKDKFAKRTKVSPSRHDYLAHKDSPIHSERTGGADPAFRRGRSPVQTERKDDIDKRRRSLSPPRSRDTKDTKKKSFEEPSRKRDSREGSPRGRDDRLRQLEKHSKREEDSRSKKAPSPVRKGGRNDKVKESISKERNNDADSSWNDDNKKNSNSARSLESRNRQDNYSQQINNSQSRERDRDRNEKDNRERKKGKDQERSGRQREDADRSGASSPPRSQSPSRSHRPQRDPEPPLTRGRGYDPEVPPPPERDYGYPYEPRTDQMYLGDRHLMPDYGPELRRGPIPLCGPDMYPERYRRDVALKDHNRYPGVYDMGDILPPRDLLPARDLLPLPRRPDDYLGDIPIDERHLYDERWARNRPLRDDWTAYSGLPPAPLPLTSHLPPPGLDEDRYGMPRRRCPGSPEWPPLRSEKRERERELNLSPRSQSRDLKSSRTPPPPSLPPPPPPPPPSKRSSDVSPTGRSNYEHSSRHSSRGSDGRHDNQQKRNVEPSQFNIKKISLKDDKKGRANRRDHGNRREMSTTSNDKPRQSNKRHRSQAAAPQEKDTKKKKKDDGKSVNEKKPSASSSVKDESAAHSSVTKSESRPASPKTTKPEIEEKKIKVEEETAGSEKGAAGEFSDWSDDDDDLLTRDDFPEEEEVKVEGGKGTQEESSKKSSKDGKDTEKEVRSLKDGSYSDKSKEKVKQSHSRTGSRERSVGEISTSKTEEPIQDSKQSETLEGFITKDDVDVDDIINTSVDYDPISDDEFEAMIEDPDNLDTRPSEMVEKSGIADSLDVDWSSLINESPKKLQFGSGGIRKRFSACRVLQRIGFSQVYAGPELTKKLTEFCQEQIKQEVKPNKDDQSEDGDDMENKFILEHPVAGFHVAIMAAKKERSNIMNDLGPYRRSLCARRDLQIRRQLCKPINKTTDLTLTANSSNFSQQQHTVDKELYKLSLELFNKTPSSPHLPQPVHVSC